MSVLDIVFAVILLWAAYRGFTKGLIYQLSTLAALLLGILGAIKFSGFTSDLLIRQFDINEQYMPIIAFAITFILIVVLVHLLAKLVERLMDAVALGFVNRTLGILFALLKTGFIISILMVLVNKVDNRYNFIPEETKQESLLYQPLSDFAPMVFPYLKFDEWKEQIDETGVGQPDKKV